jgi:hypothetical protein
MGGLLVMNQAERDRLCVIRGASEKRISRRQAAERLGVKPRQVRRLLEEYRDRGDAIAIHGLKGAEGNRGKRRESCIRELVTQLYREHYSDYGPTLLSETLSERHQLDIPRQTVRRWLEASGARKPKRARCRRHPRRDPRPRWGDLVQLDTSKHLWFERRGGTEYAYLICGIDDATSEVWGRFYEGDTSLANMDAIRRWVERNGRPGAFYVDCARHFAGQLDEDGGDTRHDTQIGRMLGELEIEPILAYSPQAKGRVERTFGTHQDRLVKKLRERGIATIAAANEYLEREYWAEHNRKFARHPSDPVDAHRELTVEQRRSLREISAVRFNRTLGAGDIVKLDGRSLLVSLPATGGPRRGVKLEVLLELSGAMRLRYEGRDLVYRDVTENARDLAERRHLAARNSERHARLVAELVRKDVRPSGRFEGRSLDSLSVLELQALRPPQRPTEAQRYGVRVRS